MTQNPQPNQYEPQLIKWMLFAVHGVASKYIALVYTMATKYEITFGLVAQ